MNSVQALAGEAIIAIGVVSWRNLKGGYAPLPNEIVLSGLSFCIIGVVSYASPDLAALLGAGFLLAILIKELQKPANADPYYNQAPAGYSPDNLIMVRQSPLNIPGAKG